MSKEDYKEEEALAKMVSKHHNQGNDTDSSMNEIMGIFSLKDETKKKMPNITMSGNNSDEDSPFNEIAIIGEEIINNNSNKKELQEKIQNLIKNTSKILDKAIYIDKMISKIDNKKISEISKNTINQIIEVLNEIKRLNKILERAQSSKEILQVQDTINIVVNDINKVEKTLNSVSDKYYSILSATAQKISNKSCSANKTLKSNTQRKEDHLREKQRKERKKKIISTILILSSLAVGGTILHKTVTPHVTNFIEKQKETKKMELIEETIKNKTEELRIIVLNELADDDAIYLNRKTNEIIKKYGKTLPSLYNIKLDSVKKAYIVYTIMGDFEFNKILQSNGYMYIEEFLNDFGYKGNYDNFEAIAKKEIENEVLDELNLVKIIDNGEEITIRRNGGRR